ncbi:MAG: arginine--tRNA ligase [Candidatus Jorgensenbacteria bacterium]
MREKIIQLLQSFVPAGTPIEVSVPEEEKFGHYATNVAFALAKAERAAPMAVAKRLAGELAEAGRGLFARVEAAGNGFINFFLKDEALWGALENALERSETWGCGEEGAGKTVMVEYFQLNVAKVPHVGHLRSAVIGDALKRVFTARGYHAVSDTHVGDWGTQFGILLYGYRSLDEEARRALAAEPFEALNCLYQETNRRIEEQPELREAAKEEFAKLERGDAENRRIWEWMLNASMKKLGESAARLGLLPFDEHRGESAYERDMPPLVALAFEKGVAARKPDGAVVVDLTSEGLDEAVLVKSDGASTYLLRDLATIRYRKKQWDFFKNLYVVDVRQSHHFRQVFRVAELLGFEGVGASVHVDFGFMSLPEGAMSTRHGTTTPLNEVLDDIIERARTVIQEKNPALEEKDAVANAVGIGALKYFDLSHHRQSNVVFRGEEAISFEGNTGPYIQYTHARLKSILRKAGSDAVRAASPATELNADERALAALIARFPETVADVLIDFAPSMLANHLFALAQTANRFYHANPVLQEPDHAKKAARLTLVQAAALSLHNGLNLLGISALEKM